MRTRSSASSVPSARPGLGRGVLVALVALLAAACSSWTPDSAPAATTAAPSAAPTTSAPASSAAAPAATGDLARARVRLQEVARLESPVGMALRKGDSGAYFIEQAGRVRVLRNGRVDPSAVLDVSGQVKAGGEQGLLGIAFSPDGGHLYVEIGEGGSAGDPNGNGQSLGTLLGKILRIDPRPSGAQPYGIPRNNPFVDRTGARAEIWDYGLRNPWRFSFDPTTRDLWIADVGQGDWEEVDHEPAGRGGRNYGWNRLEGTHRFNGDPPAGAVAPVLEYNHDGGACTVIGGSVYR